MEILYIDVLNVNMNSLINLKMKEIKQFICPYCKHITIKNHEICPACGTDSKGVKHWSGAITNTNPDYKTAYGLLMDEGWEQMCDESQTYLDKKLKKLGL